MGQSPRASPGDSDPVAMLSQMGYGLGEGDKTPFPAHIWPTWSTSCDSLPLRAVAASGPCTPLAPSARPLGRCQWRASRTSAPRWGPAPIALAPLQTLRSSLVHRRATDPRTLPRVRFSTQNAYGTCRKLPTLPLP
jgi:hypothetical protein